MCVFMVINLHALGDARHQQGWFKCPCLVQKAPAWTLALLEVKF